MTATQNGHRSITDRLWKQGDDATTASPADFPTEAFALNPIDVDEVPAGPEQAPAPDPDAADSGGVLPTKLPILPAWMRSPGGIHRNVVHVAPIALHNGVLYWGLKRGYIFRPLVWSGRGAWRAAGELVRFTFDIENREARREAHKRGDQRARAHHRQEIHKSRGHRVKGTLAWLAGIGAYGMVLTGPTVPLWLKVPLALGGAAGFAKIGRPEGETKAGAALLPHQDQDPAKTTLHSSRVTAAFASKHVKIEGAVTLGGMHIRPHGPKGWEGVVELPESTTASMAIDKREELASAFRVDEPRLVLARGAHAGQVRLTIFHRDPMTEDPIPSPLRTMDSFNLWDPVPIGTTVYGDPYSLVLPGTSGTWICSAPGYGKTNLLQLLLAAAALDPRVVLYIHDGKGEGDLEMWAPLAAHYSQGASEGGGRDCARMLKKVSDLRESRRALLSKLRAERPDLMPSSQITPAVTSDATLDLPLVLVVLDELNELAETKSGTDIKNGAKGLAQIGRSGGIILVPAGQRFDADTLGGAQSSMGTRIAFRTNSPADSNMVLGGGQVGEGFDTSKWPDHYQGVSIVRPGGVQAHKGTQQIKTHLAGELADLSAIAARAWRLRASAGQHVGDERAAVKAEALGLLDHGENVCDVQTLAERGGLPADQLKARLEAAGVDLKPSSRHGGRLSVRRDQLTDGL